MNDKTWLGKKKNVLHPGYEGQNSVGQEEKCPSSIPTMRCLAEILSIS
jgi:hypothetical protein